MQAPVHMVTDVYDGPLPARVRARMLECGLWDRTARRSALLDLWTGRAPGLQVWSEAEGLEISLAWLTPDDPLGVLVLERRAASLFASVPSGAVPEYREMVVRVVGAVAVYVRPEFRGRGMARALVRGAEMHRMEAIAPSMSVWGAGDVPAVVAGGAAIDVVRAAAKWLRAIPGYHASSDRDEALLEISRATQGPEGNHDNGAESGSARRPGAISSRASRRRIRDAAEKDGCGQRGRLSRR